MKAAAKVHTYALLSYNGLTRDYVHNVIDHAERGTLMVRCTRTALRLLVALEAHADCHVRVGRSFQCFAASMGRRRFNNHTETDLARFVGVLWEIVSMRLTYKALPADEAGI